MKRSEINEWLTFTGKQTLPIDNIYILIDTLSSDSENDIPIDHYDVTTVLHDQSYATVSSVEFTGDNTAYEAINQLMELLDLKDKTVLNKFSGAIIHFKMNSEYPFMDLASAMDLLYTHNEEADLIFGTTTDDTLADNFIRITAITVERSKILVLNNINFSL